MCAVASMAVHVATLVLLAEDKVHILQLKVCARLCKAREEKKRRKKEIRIVRRGVV